MRTYLISTFYILFICCGVVSHERPVASIVHHDVQVRIVPESHQLDVSDRLTIRRSPENAPLYFMLNASLGNVALAGSTPAQLSKISKATFEKQCGVSLSDPDQPELAFYQIISDRPDTLFTVTLTYSGTVYDSLDYSQQEYARGFAQTSGLIDPRGVYLAGSSYWLPSQSDDRFTFRLTTDVPKNWATVSQGAQQKSVHNRRVIQVWECDKPMEEIYLVAGPFHIYDSMYNDVRVAIFLRDDDAALAEKYIKATGRYLAMYERMIGPYPFRKFALVENFWQTGYGMPSFTLLGSQVIRLPFIIHTSYGHEILHNWWGNGVYVDWKQGNWCEGLTNYMADHYYKAQRGQDANYRRSMLQGFLNYVKAGKDFPLSQFEERHNAASQAVGYSKSAMVFHMLKMHVGEAAFRKAIRYFYQKNKFKAASWQDLQAAFESQANETDLDWFFKQWIQQKGAPTISIESVQVDDQNGKTVVRFELAQTEPVYRLDVPVLFRNGRDTLVMVTFNKIRQQYEIPLMQKPHRMIVDPHYDVFRFLDRREIPPALSQTMGADRATVIIPENADENLKTAYRQTVEKWRIQESVTIVTDAEIDSSNLPPTALWIFGRENQMARVVQNNLKHELTWDNSGWHFQKTVYPEKDHAQVITIRHPNRGDLSLTYINVDRLEDIPVITRKLPHYGKYGYLLFHRDRNIVKGEWEIQNSPLIKDME